MAKKKSWFTLVKRFFTSDSSQSHQEKKEKRKKWVFARLRMKRIPSLTAPPPQPQDIEKEKEKENKEETERAKNVCESETEEKQSHRAISVAIASAAAAEAAVAAAHAAAEVVLLTCKPRSADVAAETGKGGDILDSSAVKIQTAFRGYLARKALRALKGIVTLQAIIRGRAVRRQAVTTLKRLQSIVNIQSQLCANSFQCHVVDHNADEDELNSFREKLLRMESYSERRWDDSLMSKEEAHASLMSKKEASIKRQRIRQYWHQHRKSAESERNEISGRWRYWLEQWVDTQLTKSKDDLQDLHSKQHLKEDLHSKQQLNTRPHHLMNHRRQCSVGDETSFPGSPATATNFPTYMAATESARARARSASSPKLRAESLDGFSPSKNRLSLVPDQRSPSLKGIRGPVKFSGRKVNDLSFDSECSLSHWNQQQHYTFRP